MKAKIARRRLPTRARGGVKGNHHAPEVRKGHGNAGSLGGRCVFEGDRSGPGDRLRIPAGRANEESIMAIADRTSSTAQLSS